MVVFGGVSAGRQTVFLFELLKFRDAVALWQQRLVVFRGQRGVDVQRIRHFIDFDGMQSVDGPGQGGR